MSIEKYLIQNTITLEKFTSLQLQNGDPKLAVSTNGRLVIYSQKSEKTIDKVIQFVKSIFYRISFALGFIKIDEEAINLQKQKVQDSIILKAEKIKKGIIGEFEDLNKKIKLLKIVDSTLASKISSSKEEIKDTTQSLEICKKELSTFNEVSQKLKTVQKELEESEKRLKALQNEKKILSQDIESRKRNEISINAEYGMLAAKKKQVDALKAEFEHWNSKAQSAKAQSQIDYKKKAEQAEENIHQLEMKINEIRMKCNCGMYWG